MAKLGISLIYISGSALQPHNRLTYNFSLPSHYILSRTKSNKNTKTIHKNYQLEGFFFK